MLGASPFEAPGVRVANGQAPPQTTGYGPLVPKPPVGVTEGTDNTLALPAEFNYQAIDRQGLLQRDGSLTPGIFDAMGAFPNVGSGAAATGRS